MNLWATGVTGTGAAEWHISRASLLISDPACGKFLAAVSLWQDGKYCVLKMDPNFTPTEMELRQVYGLNLLQPQNNLQLTEQLLMGNCVTKNKDAPASAKADMLLATIALKYTQSNSVCYAHRGQIVGLGAGQQSRIHCTRLAGEKADNWRLRHHPNVLAFQWKKVRPVTLPRMGSWVRQPYLSCP